MVFAIGFFARPVGAALFGHLGDRQGRKKSLLISIVVMAACTFAIGALPSYAMIGPLAPILLILFRIGQGLSAGGESTGATLYAMEAHFNHKRGFIGGLMWGVVGLGILLGSFAALIVLAFPQYTWAWRVPFLLSVITGFIGYFIRRKTMDSMDFQQAVKEKKLIDYPLYHGYRHYKLIMLRIFAVYVLSAMISYLVFIFMPNYASNYLAMPLASVTLISSIALGCTTLLVPLGGYLSDVIGRKKMMRYSALGFFVLSYPLFYLISRGGFSNYIIAEGVFVLLAFSFQGPLNAFVAEQVPLMLRFSVVAVSYNLAYSIFGGTAPVVANYLVTLSNNKAAPGFYLMFGSLLAILATLKVDEGIRPERTMPISGDPSLHSG